MQLACCIKHKLSKLKGKINQVKSLFNWKQYKEMDGFAVISRPVDQGPALITDKIQ